MLKLLLDENVGHIVAAGLRKEGYDIQCIQENSPGAADLEVLQSAKKDKRIIVTLDRDFGRLVFLDSQKHVGVVFLRLRNESPENILSVLIRFLAEYGARLHTHFVTVSEERVRMR